MIGIFNRRFFTQLYTWGNSSSSLGHEKSATINSITLPKLLEFSEPVKKCVLGPSHSAILTESGDVYTFGNGNYGTLGHNSEDKVVLPKKVEGLSKMDLRAVDVAIGNYHTVIATDEGDVFTMGYGGELSGGFFRNFFSQKGGGLGHGDLDNRFVPTLVQSIRDSSEKIVSVSAGAYHSLALSEKGVVFSWGKGEMGVLGTGKNKTYLSPHPISLFNLLREKGMTVKKLQTHNYSNIALLNNGKVVCWGWNEVGQLALGNYVRADMYDTESKPVEPEFFSERQVKDFELGEDASIFLTEDNKVFFAGIRLYREPKELTVPAGSTVKKIFVCKKVGGFITDDNKVYANGNLFNSKFMEEDVELRMWKVKNSAFNDLVVEDIGGGSGNHYCLLR